MIARLRPLGIAALLLLLAWFAGGQRPLGRVDPALALPLLLLPMLALGWWQRGEPRAARQRAILATLLAVAVGQGLFAWLLAGRAGWGQIALVLVVGAAAGWLSDALVQRRTWARALRVAVAAVVLAAWFVAGHALLARLYRAPAPSTDAPVVTMLTGLPLRWSGDDLTAMIAAGAQEDPALARIEAAGPMRLVDSLADHVPPPGGTLLLAHPRALAPRDLIAVDAFVRGGGRAVILADALSGWPVERPLGDPRNPPVTSLLTPLLDHWGITLGAAPVGETAARAYDVGGARLRLFSAGRFERLPPTCAAFAGGRVAQCRIGAGEAWLVGDADLLFAPLWRPAVPGADHLRRADTMEWLDARLRGAGAERALLHPLWIRARQP
ncbi:Gldg family protein [Sphingopyxis sp. NJF-3]